jgi:hypothetical protein
LENVSKLDSGWEYGREGRIGFGGRSGEEKRETFHFEIFSK